MKTELLAVMFTDIVGYTQRTNGQTYEENAALLHEHAQIVHPLIRQLGGRIVKEIGDGVLATFASPTHAVEAAMAIQDRLAQLNSDRAGAGSVAAAHRDQRWRSAGGARRRVRGRGQRGGAYRGRDAGSTRSTSPGATYLTMNRSGLFLVDVGERSFKA